MSVNNSIRKSKVYKNFIIKNTPKSTKYNTVNKSNNDVKLSNKEISISMVRSIIGNDIIETPSYWMDKKALFYCYGVLIKNFFLKIYYNNLEWFKTYFMLGQDIKIYKNPFTKTFYFKPSKQFKRKNPYTKRLRGFKVKK